MKEPKRLLGLLGVFILAAGLVFPILHAGTASADQITDRSLTLQAGTGTGGSEPDADVNDLFTFTAPSGDNVSSIKFLYCTLPGSITDPCTTPTGLHTTGATLGTQTGATFNSLIAATGDGGVDGAPYLSRTSAAPLSGPVSFQLLTVHNPQDANETFFVRIATYASQDATGTAIDTGTVAAATASPIVLTGTMPESLVFCTGATISAPGDIPDCSTATSGEINFNQLFSPTDTATATSQMAASTNAGSGYNITVNGPTLTSGTNTITAMGTAGPSTHGASQFGLNLAVNTTPAIGTAIAPVSNGTNYRAEPIGDYATANTFKFTSTESVADSGEGGSLGGTDAQIYTASYIVNVPGSQPAGTYVSTLTYICTPDF